MNLTTQLGSQNQSGQILHADRFPLFGSRLIEASAGTGKTWTIASLYVRLVLGHGDEHAHPLPLHPAQILVMTFTRAATRELSDRIRQRLNQAAALFRGETGEADEFLAGLLNDYPDPAARELAAYRLAMAAQAMDEAAVMTIDAWCQRMLKEHAFDSACLFDENLISDERRLQEQALRDYWRQQIYPLNGEIYQQVSQVWPDLSVLETHLRALLGRTSDLAPAMLKLSLADFIAAQQTELLALATPLKQRCQPLLAVTAEWILSQRERNPKQFSAIKFKPALIDTLLNHLQDWLQDSRAVQPEALDKILEKFSPANMLAACNKGYTPELPSQIGSLIEQLELLQQLPGLPMRMYQHAAWHIAERIAVLKQQQHQAGFNDMLQRLRAALLGANGAVLRQRILLQFPVALIDEFQDTSPDQFAIFNAIYRIADNAPDSGLFLIGDPKQSIYGFRGADIYSYLKARRATAGRHYVLGTNFRSSRELVAAVNLWFEYPEQDAQNYPGGAFLFRKAGVNDLPFEPVAANGKPEQWQRSGMPEAVFQIACGGDSGWRKDQRLQYFAGLCAEHIVTRLNDPSCGFFNGSLRRLQSGDIAILVRDRYEADAVRKALQQRQVASVYLSDKDSIFQSQEAGDLLRWLAALANPLDYDLARAAYACRTTDLSIAQLAHLSSDEQAWDACLMQVRELHAVWQRQGVLAAIRRFVLELNLPVRLLSQPGGERSLTNILHLAELLEQASEQLDGELALVRWLVEAIDQDDGSSEEHVLRLESDAELVKIITVHKSKGLQFPLVYLPFANSFKDVSRRNRLFFEYSSDDGQRQLDFKLSQQALQQVQLSRLREDLRLFYVALTRPVYGVWLGVANTRADDESALAYLLTGQYQTGGGLIDALKNLIGRHPELSIEITEPDQQLPLTMLAQSAGQPVLPVPPVYLAEFERNWSIGSFSALTRQLNLQMPVARIHDSRYLDDDTEEVPQQAAQSWHAFPRGALPGQFLHEQLEWMAGEGFDYVAQEGFSAHLLRRCENAGWTHHQQTLQEWLGAIAQQNLPPVGCSLSQLALTVPELEFWFPCQQVASAALDQYCQQQFWPSGQRPPLTRTLMNGLMMGFADLVFEHQGRYWIIDYKSNALGHNDSAYHADALQHAVLAHRYDVQATIYQLALHRLLGARLGEAYRPEQQIGGVVFLFLRGIANPHTHGCCHLPFSAQALQQLETILPATRQETEA